MNIYDSFKKNFESNNIEFFKIKIFENSNYDTGLCIFKFENTFSTKINHGKEFLNCNVVLMETEPLIKEFGISFEKEIDKIKNDFDPKAKLYQVYYPENNLYEEISSYDLFQFTLNKKRSFLDQILNINLCFEIIKKPLENFKTFKRRKIITLTENITVDEIVDGLEVIGWLINSPEHHDYGEFYFKTGINGGKYIYDYLKNFEVNFFEKFQRPILDMYNFSEEEFIELLNEFNFESEYLMEMVNMRNLD